MTRTLRTLLVAALLTLGVAVAPAPASAALSDCPNISATKHLCFFTQTNYGGTQLTYDSSAPGTCRNIPGAYTGAVSSVANETQAYAGVTIFQGANCTGANCPFGNLQETPSVSTWCGSGWDNNVRSWMFHLIGG